MGKDGLKVDWKKAAQASLAEEKDVWEDWKWQKAQKRWKTFKMLDRIQKLSTNKSDRWELQYYRNLLKPDFGPSHAILGLKRRESTGRESTSF